MARSRSGRAFANLNTFLWGGNASRRGAGRGRRLRPRVRSWLVPSTEGAWRHIGVTGGGWNGCFTALELWRGGSRHVSLERNGEKSDENEHWEWMKRRIKLWRKENIRDFIQKGEIEYTEYGFLMEDKYAGTDCEMMETEWWSAVMWRMSDLPVERPWEV